MQQLHINPFFCNCSKERRSHLWNTNVYWGLHICYCNFDFYTFKNCTFKSVIFRSAGNWDYPDIFEKILIFTVLQRITLLKLYEQVPRFYILGNRVSQNFVLFRFLFCQSFEKCIFCYYNFNLGDYLLKLTNQIEASFL